MTAMSIVAARSPIAKPDVPDLLARARTIASLARERAQQTEVDRRVGEDMIARMRELDLFRIMRPQAYGGFEYGFDVFSDIVAVSGEEGKFESDLTGAKVLASVVGEGRGDKILVFKLKRKKQYKKMQGHRQNFVEVKINEILVNGKSFKEEAK